MRLTSRALRLLANQYGLATRPQLVRAGSSPDLVDGLVRRGTLRAVQRGVYRLEGSFVPQEQYAMAAVLRAGADARLAGEHALALYGVEGAGFAAPPTVLVPPHRRVERVDFCVLRTQVAARDRAVVAGLPTLRIERAVLELARGAGERRLLQVVDSARWLGLLRIPRLVDRARDMGPHHPGARRLLAVHARGDLGPESHGERDLQAFLLDVPGHFEWGVDDVLPGVRFDAYERRARLALEYDGERDHTSQRDVFADRSRELRVREAGIELIRVTRGMLREERELTRSRVTAVLADRLSGRRRG